LDSTVLSKVKIFSFGILALEMIIPRFFGALDEVMEVFLFPTIETIFQFVRAGLKYKCIDKTIIPRE